MDHHSFHHSHSLEEEDQPPPYKQDLSSEEVLELYEITEKLYQELDAILGRQTSNPDSSSEDTPATSSQKHPPNYQ
jgi:hypothetical protein